MVITTPAVKICWKISHTLKSWYTVSAKSITILLLYQYNIKESKKVKVKETNQQKESKLKYLKTGVGINWNNH